MLTVAKVKYIIVCGIVSFTPEELVVTSHCGEDAVISPLLVGLLLLSVNSCTRVE